jgi:hypothetical protein
LTLPVQDARETFQSMTSLSAGEGIAPGEEDFERKLRQMMQVYSPGYPDAKAPELVVNANRYRAQDVRATHDRVNVGLLFPYVGNVQVAEEGASRAGWEPTG